MSTPKLSSYAERYSFARGATRRNEAHASHLQSALAEIDGLFAGLRYLDKTEPPANAASPVPATPAFSTIWCYGSVSAPPNGCQTELESLTPAPQTDQTTTPVDPYNTSSVTTPDAARHDWSAIRDVRQGMEMLWEKFESAVDELQVPAIDAIHQYYESAKGLRETGVFAFRNTLTGPVPNDLKRIFAFGSLSYVVSCLLYEKGRIPQHDILSGIQVWMNAIDDQKQRQAFQMLAQELWPEAKNHLHFIPLKFDPRSKIAEGVYTPGGQHHFREGFPNPSTQAATDCGNVAQIPSTGFHASPTTEEAVGGTMQGHISHPSTTLLEEADDCLSSWKDYLDFTKFGPYIDQDVGLLDPQLTYPDTGQGDPPNQRQEAVNADTQQFMVEHVVKEDEFEQARPHQKTTSASDLQSTKMFWAILHFFDYCGELLFLLSGEGRTAKCLQSYLSLVQEKLQVKKQIQKFFIEPLRRGRHAQMASFRAVLSIAKRFVELGFLQSEDETRDYMVRVGKAIIDHGAYTKFLQWVFGSVPEARNKTYGGRIKKKRRTGAQANAGKHACPKCSRRFNRKFNLTRHVGTVHDLRKDRTAVAVSVPG
ncbi:Fc.00g021800.m01.CDS01 [Cosmosporella sp. VM-42]